MRTRNVKSSDLHLRVQRDFPGAVIHPLGLSYVAHRETQDSDRLTRGDESGATRNVERAGVEDAAASTAQPDSTAATAVLDEPTTLPMGPTEPTASAQVVTEPLELFLVFQPLNGAEGHSRGLRVAYSVTDPTAPANYLDTALPSDKGDRRK